MLTLTRVGFETIFFSPKQSTNQLNPMQWSKYQEEFRRKAEFNRPYNEAEDDLIN